MKFVDFFAGIGGIRLGLEQAGHECVGFCEWDKYARTAYKACLNVYITAKGYGKMTCKHNLKVDVTRYKNHMIYRVFCEKCGRRTVWGESPELAKEFDDMLLSKKGVRK